MIKAIPIFKEESDHSKLYAHLNEMKDEATRNCEICKEEISLFGNNPFGGIMGLSNGSEDWIEMEKKFYHKDCLLKFIAKLYEEV